MASVKIKLLSRGMADLLKSAGVRADMTARAERALAAAQSSAPVASGAYRDGLHVEVVEHPTRVVARVVGGSDHDLVVEANTGCLARSLDSAR